MAGVVSFNGIDIPSFIRVTGINFPVLPDIEVRESNVPNRFGNVDNGVKFSGIPIDLDIKIVRESGTTIHEQAALLKKWARGNSWKPSKLVFKEQPTKYLMARVSNNIDINDLFTMGEGTISFYAADPARYSVNENSFPSSTGSLSCQYLGVEKAASVITITIKANCINLDLKHTPSNRTVKLLGSFTAGQVVIIDSDKKVIKLNNKVEMKLLDFSSKWLYLEEGSNVFTLTTTTPAIVNSMTIKFRQVD